MSLSSKQLADTVRTVRALESKLEDCGEEEIRDQVYAFVDKALDHPDEDAKRIGDIAMNTLLRMDDKEDW